MIVLVLQSAVRRRTQQLEASRARFRRLAEATSEGIAIHEEDGTIIDVNTALADMLGRERDEVLCRDISTVLSQTSSGSSSGNGKQHVQGLTEAELVSENGETIPVEIEESTVATGEEPVHVCAIRDITKRREWENEILLAKREAEEMSQLKSSLLNNMSHELRTPITGITGYAELLTRISHDKIGIGPVGLL